MKNFRSFISKINKKIKHYRKINYLLKNKNIPVDFYFFLPKPEVKEIESFDYTYKIWGIEIDPYAINWNKDLSSNHEYPVERFDKYKIQKTYNNQHDILFCWELHTLRIAFIEALKYHYDKNDNYYKIFKHIVNDWYSKNKYLYGVGWIDPMTTGIRSTLLVLSLNILQHLIEKDTKFFSVIKQLLIEHAKYLYKFNQFNKKGYSSNHAVCSLASLLLLSFVFRNYPDAKKWKNFAIDGLEICMRNQVNADGSSFEGSLPYHYLAQEIFTWAFYWKILADDKNINNPYSAYNHNTFSEKYHYNLCLMQLFSQKIIRNNYQCWQIGDDAPNFIFFSTKNNTKYDEVLRFADDLKIVYRMYSPQHRLSPFSFLYGSTKNDNPQVFNEIEEHFWFFGINCEKNEAFSMLISLTKHGQDGKGGHNHYDQGSILLDIGNIPIFIDSGTGNYTKSLTERNKFRSIGAHNTVYSEKMLENIPENKDFFRLSPLFKAELTHRRMFSEVGITITNIYNNEEIYRLLQWTNESLSITDTGKGKLVCNFILNPDLTIKKQHEYLLFFYNNTQIAEFESSGSINITDTIISPAYGIYESTKKLIITGENQIYTKITFQTLTQ